MSETKTAVVVDSTDVAFSDIRDQLGTIAEDNQKLVFDYATDEGEKAAKKQIRSLRKIDKEIGEIHKAVKAPAWETCKKVDAVKRELCELVADMVAVHKGPLEAKEKAEAERVQMIADRIALIVSFDDVSDKDSATIEKHIAKLESIEITADYAERMAEATNLKSSILHELNVQLEEAKKSEAETAELEQLRLEKAEREREEREKKIAEDAAAKAKADAEAAEKKRKENEAKAEAKRLADQKHVDSVKQAIAEELVAKCGMSLGGGVAAQIVGLIADGEIQNVSIKF